MLAIGGHRTKADDVELVVVLPDVGLVQHDLVDVIPLLVDVRLVRHPAVNVHHATALLDQLLCPCPPQALLRRTAVQKKSIHTEWAAYYCSACLWQTKLQQKKDSVNLELSRDRK